MNRKIWGILIYKSNNRLVEEKTKSIIIEEENGKYTDILILPKLHSKLKIGDAYIFYCVPHNSFLCGFLTQFEAIIFSYLIDVKGIGINNCMGVMRLFYPYELFLRRFSLLKNTDFTTCEGIGEVLNKRIHKQLKKMWEEGYLDD